MIKKFDLHTIDFFNFDSKLRENGKRPKRNSFGFVISAYELTRNNQKILKNRLSSKLYLGRFSNPKTQISDLHDSKMSLKRCFISDSF